MDEQRARPTAPDDPAGRATAIPARLTAWQRWTAMQNELVRRAAQRLDAAIDDLNASDPSPELLPRLGPIGAEVASYVLRNEESDAWVGAVGGALLDLARSRLPESAAADAANTALLAGGLVTTTDARLAARVEPGAPDLERRRGEAARLAEEVAEALDSDGGTLREALRTVGERTDDAEAAGAFLRALGADRTLRAAAAVDAAGLAVLRRVLAAASRLEDEEPALLSSLFADRVPASLLLLGEEAFSEVLLSAAGDAWLRLGSDGEETATPEEAGIVLDALAASPGAALAFLVDSSQGDADAALPQSRLAEVLVRYAAGLERPGPIADGLNRVLSQAAESPQAEQEYGGPFGGAPQVAVLLHDLAALPAGVVPRTLGPGIAAVVARHLGVLVRGGRDAWQDRILDLALRGPGGGIEPARIAMLDDGFAAWQARTVPSDYQPARRRNRTAWEGYLRQAGTLAGLLARATGTPRAEELREALTAQLAGSGADPVPGTELQRAADAYREAGGA